MRDQGQSRAEACRAGRPVFVQGKLPQPTVQMSLPHSFLSSSDGRSTPAWRLRLSQALDRHEVPDSAVVMFTGLVVGVGAGLGAVIFRRLRNGVQSLTSGELGRLLSGIAPLRQAIIPVIGGLIVRPTL